MSAYGKCGGVRINDGGSGGRSGVEEERGGRRRGGAYPKGFSLFSLIEEEKGIVAEAGQLR